MKKKMFTMSYDDGVRQDRRLVALMNQYGIKCTFNLNSGFFSQVHTIIRGANGELVYDHSHIDPEEVKTLYEGHEVATHSVTHPNLVGLEEPRFTEEICGDMETLSKLAGYKVNGHAYPGGKIDDIVPRRLEAKGIRYARTTKLTYAFDAPEDLLLWHPSCFHLDEKLPALTEEFLKADSGLFYVWGHAYELDYYNGWERIEEFFKKISGHDDIMYLTNSQVLDELGL